MDLRNLKHVVALAKTLNYLRAGEAIGLSQSALTRSIQAVERECRVKLFDRSRGGVQLTRHGLAFVERAETLLAGADDLAGFMQRAAGAEEGDMPFGIEPLPARALLPAVLSPLIVANPNMRNRVLIRSIEALWEQLKAGEIDFFISAQGRTPFNPRVRAAPLGTFPLSCLVRAGHPALLDDKDEGPYPVLLAGEAGAFEQLSPRLQRLISGPRHIIEDYDILAKILENSDAILISSRFAVQEEMKQGLICELADKRHAPGMIQIMMYSLENKSLSPAAFKLKKSFQDKMRSVTMR